MFKNEEFIKKFTDMMSEGFIFIDTTGKIQIYNRKAKEIFGIEGNKGIDHRPGVIQKGDIVIIGDNCLGKDDGNLTPESLKSLGIHDKNIKIGDAIIAIGVIDSPNIVPVYKYQKDGSLELRKRFLGNDIYVIIDAIEKYIKIEVNKQEFLLPYNNAIGHIVILENKTKEIKFYQTKGYTARGEGIQDLLSGKPYRGKGKYADTFDVIGKNIFEIHSPTITIKEFYEVATGKDLSYEEKFTEINGRSTICTLKPINKNNKRVGAVLKVEDISEIKKVIRERDEALLNLERMEEKLKEKEDISFIFPDVIGDSQEISYVRHLAYKASKTNSTVLILGESGTGKSLLAKAIHQASKYKDKPFIYVNSSSIPENLLESELFGYEGGAFTGARREGKIGIFEMADGGTIFLDEIGELSIFLQAKLLQVLQNKSFYRVGGNKRIEVDVRIIAATNKNLEEEMLKGHFREDLYYRINVFPIWIPPLRDRKQDLYPLIENLLPKICCRIGCQQKHISGEALQMLLDYSWPGNVRELENVLERAVNLAESNTILSKHLILGTTTQQYIDKNNNIKTLRKIIEEAEKRGIEEALKLTKGNKREAMKILSIGKTSFYEKLKKYAIE